MTDLHKIRAAQVRAAEQAAIADLPPELLAGMTPEIPCAQPAHTPGPWATWDSKEMQALGVTGPTAAAAMTATADIQRLGYAKCSEVLTVNQQVAAIALGKTQAEAHANARLIAAAPQMLEALIDCRRALELATFTGELAVIDAAIAKAIGARA